MDRHLLLGIAALTLSACTGLIGEGSDGSEASTAIGPAGLRLLTPIQYQNSVRDVLGAEVPAVGQWRSSIAAAQGGVSLTAVEEYEAAANEASAYVFRDAGRRSAIVTCVPEIAPDDACVREVVSVIGRRAWRRALTSDELTRYGALAASTAALFSDPWRGIEFAVAGLLQSPNFLYRVELGEEDPEHTERLRFASHEMASRLSYLVWNSTPDDELIAAAERGELLTEEGIAAQLERLLASDRAFAGLGQLFADLLDLDALLSLHKDPQWLPLYSETIGPAMREQLALTVRSAALGEDGDYRNLFDTRTTFVNAELATLQGLSGSFGPDFTQVELADDGPRAGFLTLPGVMALHSGEADTSPTRRGKFVRSILLCQTIPPPPPNVSTVIPAPAPDELVTTRDLLERHRTEPTCAGCHGFMDPIGLGLENFDALGGYRDKQNGLPIDASGDLDGAPFTDARGLGEALRAHSELASCLVKNLYRYASGRIETGDELEAVDELTAVFEKGGYNLRAVLRALATRQAFRFATKETEK